MSMQAILAASQSMTRMQTVQSARTQMQGTAKILLIESKQDGGNEKKEEKAEALEEKSTQLLGDLMNQATDVNETLKPDEEVTTETDTSEEKAEEAAKQPETDSFELSDSAAQHLSRTSPVKAVDKEALTYNADSSTTSSITTESAPVFTATA